MVEINVYYQERVKNTEEFKNVNEIAYNLLSFFNQEDIYQRINVANQPGASSATIQSILVKGAEKLGFSSEKKGLFSNYKTSGLRPDYYKEMSNSGILFEVERGKTIHNNMDILDLWKCHICKEAQYLFLFVPKALKQSEGGTIQNTFKKVSNRLETFFQESNYVDVNAVFIFGY